MITEGVQATFGVLSLVLGVTASVPYMKAIVAGHRPPYATYLGWFFIGITALTFHLGAIPPNNAKWSALLPGIFVLVPLAYILLLLWYRAPMNLSKRDTISLLGVAICWAIWVTSHGRNGETSLASLAALLATDLFASWPILDDARKGMESGRATRVAWFIASISAGMGLLAVSSLLSLEAVYPSYLFILMSSIFLLSVIYNPTEVI